MTTIENITEPVRRNGPDLFTPLTLGPVTLRNRIVMAPLTRNRAGPADVPQAINVDYYAQRSSAGLIISEGAPVSPQGTGYPGTPGLHTAAQVDGWRRVTDAVHGEGGRMFAQLWHVGRISHPSLQPGAARPVAPSAIRPAGDAFTSSGLQAFVTPRALATDELPGIIDQHVVAARNAMDAGFDGVEVHGANGYLLDEFLRDGTNRRADEYGGPVERRARLLLEVIEAVAEVWGAGRVGVRLSPVNSFNDITDSDPDATFGHVAKRLDGFGLAYLHVVGADFAQDSRAARFNAAALRRRFHGPYMANGGNGLETATGALAAGEADMISFGQPYVANPDLVERLARGAVLNEPDPATFYGGDERGYTDYPFLDVAAAAA